MHSDTERSLKRLFPFWEIWQTCYASTRRVHIKTNHAQEAQWGVFCPRHRTIDHRTIHTGSMLLAVREGDVGKKREVRISSDESRRASSEIVE